MVSSRRLLRIWLGIGLQSFGGGATTLTLIRRMVVDQYRWITEDEFNRDWALCQMTPGINLVALTILVGKQVAGLRGAFLSLVGLLLPSAFLTAFLTAAFVSIRNVPDVQATLKGVMPATVGLGLLTAFQMARKPLADSWRMGHFQFGFSLFLLAGSGLLLISGRLSVTVVLVIASLIGACEGALRARALKGQERS